MVNVDYSDYAIDAYRKEYNKRPPRLGDADCEEGHALGATIISAVGCGKYESVENAVKEIVKVIGCVEPDSVLVCKYEQKYNEFKKMKGVLL